MQNETFRPGRAIELAGQAFDLEIVVAHPGHTRGVARAAEARAEQDISGA